MPKSGPIASRNARDPRDHRIQLGVAVEKGELLGRQHLDGGEALGRDLLGALDDRLGPVAADPAIDPHLLAHRPAQQRMHRLVQHLALDVPQRLVDARQRAHMNGAAAIKAAAIQHRPMILDRRRVFADQIVGQFGDTGRHGFGAAFHHRLAPAGDARIGLDLEEQPARRHHKGGELGDFHEIPRPRPAFSRLVTESDGALRLATQVVAGTRRAALLSGCGALYSAP